MCLFYQLQTFFHIETAALGIFVSQNCKHLMCTGQTLKVPASLFHIHCSETNTV